MHRHSYTGRKLSRTRDQRRALLKGLAEALVIKERITTTKPKAKEIAPYLERLITKAAQNTLHSRRQVRAAVNTLEAADKLCNDLGPRFKERPGGYTRIQPAGFRRGDNAEMATVSLVENATVQPPASKATIKKTSKVESTK